MLFADSCWPPWPRSACQQLRRQTPRLALRQRLHQQRRRGPERRAARSWKAATSPWSRARASTAAAPRSAGRRGARSRRQAASASKPPTSARATREARAILEAELKKAEARQAELLKEYNNGEPEKQGSEAPQLPEVPGPRGRNEGQHRAQRERHRRHPARDRPRCRRRSRCTGLRPSRLAAIQALPGLRPAGHAGGRGRTATAPCCSPTPRSKTRWAPRAARIEGSQFRACFTEPQVLRTAHRRRRAATSSPRCATTPGCAASTTSRCRCTWSLAQTDTPGEFIVECCRWSSRPGRTAKSA